MLTPEKKVKQAVTKQLRQVGVYYFFPVTGGYGHSGVPDIVGCIRGKFFAIECKAGKNTLTTLQEREIASIRIHGGATLVVNESNVDMVTAWVLTL